MNDCKCRLIVIVLLVSFGWMALANAQITPSDDAYTNTGLPTTTFGTKPLLDVQSASQTTFIRFDLSSVPGGYTGASIAKATMKLYVNAVPVAGSFNVDYVDGSWSEKTVTANLSPALGATIVSGVALTSANVHDYVIIDITPAVQAWLDGTQANDGVALVANSPLNASFDSKESTTNSQPPELDIVYAGGGTLTGITTASGSGLSGGGTSGTLNLALTSTCAANQILQWNGSAWTCSAAGTGTVTGVTAGTDLTGGGAGGNVTVNLDTTKVPQLVGANTFVGNQTVNGNISATGTMSATGATITSSSGSNAVQISSTTGTALRGTTSATGIAILGNDTVTTGSATGVTGESASNAGYGVVGDEYSTTGSTFGVFGIVASASGVAGAFNNSAGGAILQGSNNGIQKFLVDGSGNVTAAGTIASGVTTGTAPLSVNSTTQVANLNASLLGGQPASAFASLGSNTFSGTQSISGTVAATLFAGSGSSLSNVNAAFLGGLNSTAFAQVGASNRFSQSQFINQNLEVDSAGTNGGSTTPGLQFGAGASGETIASNRTNSGAGDFQGIDIYTRGAARLTVANNGNVGIDNISPGSVLDVLGSQPAAVSNGSGNSAEAVANFVGGTGGNTSATGVIGGTGGGFNFTGGTGGNAPAGSTVGQGGSITLQPGAPGGGGGACYSGGCGNNYGRVVLAPNGGQVGIGMQPCPYGGGCYELLDVNGTGFFMGDVWADGCVLVGPSGNVIGGTCVSDMRFKKDIRPFASVLDRLVQIRPVSFTWTTDEYPGYHFGKGRSMGVLAQEVEKAFPEMVVTDKNGYKKVNYSELPFLMLQAIRDLKAENDALREQVARLQNQEARIDQLAAELDKLKGQEPARLAATLR